MSNLESVSIGQTVHYHDMTRGDDGNYHLRPITAEIDRHDFAVILNPEGPECAEPGCVEDIAHNQDTAINDIQAGKIAIAVDPANQPALDHERELYVDCFGE